MGLRPWTLAAFTPSQQGKHMTDTVKLLRSCSISWVTEGDETYACLFMLFKLDNDGVRTHYRVNPIGLTAARRGSRHVQNTNKKFSSHEETYRYAKIVLAWCPEERRIPFLEFNWSHV